MIRARTTTSLVLLLGAAMLSCSRAAPMPQPQQPADACAIDTGAPSPVVRVAVTHPVDPQHAPVPRNDSERLLFRQLYQTLVGTDCNGDVTSELAESWLSLEDGRVWEFRLRRDATFWDGTPVTPHEVMRSWSEHGFASAVAGMRAQGERELRVELRLPTSHVSLFANPDFAVARRDTAANWPIGSGSFRIDAAPAQRVIRTMSRDQRVIEFHLVNATDPRAALDAGMDALITSDAATIDYARALPGYAVAPLAWNRTYVLVTPRPQSADTAVDPEALRALARDAVRADTRPAQPPFWWQQLVCAGPRERDILVQKPRATIIYPSSDAIAKGIAERLVAFAWPVGRAPAWLRALLPAGYGSSGPPSALGRDDRALVYSLRLHDSMAFVVPAPRSPTCTQPFTIAIAPEPTLRVTPILDARDQLIHRRNIGRVLMTGDGTISFDSGAR